MPLINVKMLAGRSVEKKRTLVEVLTRETARILEVDPSVITVVIDDYPRENWAESGQLYLDRQKS